MKKTTLAVMLVCALLFSVFTPLSLAASPDITSVQIRYNGGATAVVTGSASCPEVIMILLDASGAQIALDHAAVTQGRFEKEVHTGTLVPGNRYTVKVSNLYGDSDYTVESFVAAALPEPSPSSPVPTPSPTPASTGSGSSGSSLPAWPLGKINGMERRLSRDSDGTAQLALTAKELHSFQAAHPNGAFVVEVTRETKMLLLLKAEEALTVEVVLRTDFGAVSIPRDFLDPYLGNGREIALLVQKGSLVVSCKERSQGTVITEFASPLVLSIPYAAAASGDPNAVVAVRLEDGQAKVIPFAVYDGSGLTFKSRAAGVFDAEYRLKVFVDTKGHWGEESIQFAAARDLMEGVDNQQFSPDGFITRAMLAAVLARLEGAAPASSQGQPFRDVEAKDWYAPYVAWAAGRGIISGTGDGLFAPDRPVTREEMAAMLYRYGIWKGLRFERAGADNIEFRDGNAVSSWAEEAVKVLTDAGIINGKPGLLFDPQGTATRAEAAAIMKAMIMGGQ